MSVCLCACINTCCIPLCFRCSTGIYCQSIFNLTISQPVTKDMSCDPCYRADYAANINLKYGSSTVSQSIHTQSPAFVTLRKIWGLVEILDISESFKRIQG